ncbi:MAG TPA: hypothetical protein VF111_06555 [Thermoanaerobaculia bacterium]
MIRFYCDSCNAEREDSVCWNCGRDTRQVIGSIQAPQAPAVVPPAAGSSGSSELLGSSAVPPPPPIPPEAPRGTPRNPEEPRATTDIRGLDEVHALLDRGVEAVIICGSSRAGKSEIAAGFTRANSVYRGRSQVLTLRTSVQTGYVLGGTNAGEVWFQIIDDKQMFLDPSGEFFHLLSAEYRQRFGLPDITEGDFEFVRRAVSKLSGIVLVVDLTRALDDRDFTAWRQQENDLQFVLAALRWLRHDKTAKPDAIGTRANIAQRVAALPLLDKPVLVLFSKADQLTSYVNLTPIDFAKRRLPILHGALMTHARRFRYDFCHTMVQTADGDREVDNPCGVLLPMEWLLHDRFRWLPFKLPTRSKLMGGGK